DAATMVAAARETGHVITVEDHWPEGGLGDAVLEVLAEAGATPAFRKLAPREMPGSGKPAELLAAAGIDAAGIVAAARTMVAATA
ncbi:MAG: transketolase C-terminal domain-containing protein, partial [Dehalococcoidia bacterium]